jgi:hypothetical protein
MLKVPSQLSDELEDLIHRTIGCCITVHRALGPGLLEGIYSRNRCRARTRMHTIRASEELSRRLPRPGPVLPAARPRNRRTAGVGNQGGGAIESPLSCTAAQLLARVEAYGRSAYQFQRSHPAGRLEKNRLVINALFVSSRPARCAFRRGVPEFSSSCLRVFVAKIRR